MKSAILRPGQVALLDQIDAAITTGHRRLIAQAPTGFGKTIVAAHRLRLLQDAGRRAIFTVPALSLVDQTIEKLFAEGVTDVGVIQASHRKTNPARLIQVATPQSLQRREIPDADEILLDEVHIWFSKLYPKLLSDPRFADVPIIGLTATPWSRGLGKHFDRLIVGATTEQLIEDKYLSPFRSFAPASPDLTGVRTMAGDYHEGDLADAVNKTALVANVVETWQARAENRPTLCFAVDRAHAKHLQLQFQAAGICAEYIDAYTEVADRLAIAERFHAGEVKVVCNVGCLTTGIDWDVRCIILARPTKSEILYVQMVGRGLRTAEGKADCLILDHSDNHTRLGFVTDIHHDELDDGEPKRAAIAEKTEALPKKCIKCTFLKPPKMLQCPCCGFIPVPQPGAVHRDGELIELASRRAAMATTQQERIKFHAELRHIADQRSYKSGWAAQQYKTKFGSFPPWAWNELPTSTPSAPTLSWVRSRAIAYAKRRA
jgi:superfamily II DNA or RNA helicase